MFILSWVDPVDWGMIFFIPQTAKGPGLSEFVCGGTAFLDEPLRHQNGQQPVAGRLDSCVSS